MFLFLPMRAAFPCFSFDVSSYHFLFSCCLPFAAGRAIAMLCNTRGRRFAFTEFKLAGHACESPANCENKCGILSCT